MVRTVGAKVVNNFSTWSQTRGKESERSSWPASVYIVSLYPTRPILCTRNSSPSSCFINCRVYDLGVTVIRRDLLVLFLHLTFETLGVSGLLVFEKVFTVWVWINHSVSYTTKTTRNRSGDRRLYRYTNKWFTTGSGETLSNVLCVTSVV